MTAEDDDLSGILRAVVGPEAAAIVEKNTPQMRAIIAECVEHVRVDCARVGIQSSDFVVYSTIFEVMNLMDEMVVSLVLRLGAERPGDVLNNFGLELGSMWLAAKSAKEMAAGLLGDG